MEFINNLHSFRDKVENKIEDCDHPQELDEVESEFLGPQGEIRQFTEGIGDLPDEDRPKAGKELNKVKGELEDRLSEKRDSISGTAEDQEAEGSGRVEGEYVDVTAPGDPSEVGTLHPLIETSRNICKAFRRLGFEVARGPEVETEFYNFEALNIPLDHPAREDFDNYYLEGNERLLRSHTSPMQIRLMEKNDPPLRIVVPGKCYRPDEVDASHHQMFHQVEGLMVGEDVTMRDLKGVLSTFCSAMFGEEVTTRFRPSFFPFTEPSAEVDVSCFKCSGSGCSLCGGDGWIEILGSGMVDPAVFEAVEYDTKKYTGFAFGMGVERIDMLLRGIEDIRLYTENHKEFLDQFRIK